MTAKHRCTRAPPEKEEDGAPKLTDDIWRYVAVVNLGWLAFHVILELTYQ